MRQNAIQTARARRLRRDQTPAEKLLWQMLRGRRLHGLKVRRQVPLGPWIADFYCADLKLVIEADGGQHAGKTRDIRRDAWMHAQGITVLRLWNRDILADPSACAAEILRTVGELAP